MNDRVGRFFATAEILKHQEQDRIAIQNMRQEIEAMKKLIEDMIETLRQENPQAAEQYTGRFIHIMLDPGVSDE